jgi:hypothetical protein
MAHDTGGVDTYSTTTIGTVTVLYSLQYVMVMETQDMVQCSTMDVAKCL